MYWGETTMNNNDDTLPELTFSYEQTDQKSNGLSELPFFVKHPPAEFLQVQEIKKILVLLPSVLLK